MLLFYFTQSKSRCKYFNCYSEDFQMDDCFSCTKNYYTNFIILVVSDPVRKRRLLFVHYTRLEYGALMFFFCIFHKLFMEPYT